MKKILFILALSIFMVQGIYSAELSRDQIAVSGVYPGTTTACEVVEMYGAFTARNGNMRC